MAPKKNMKMIIVGGSVAGLSLANMLEQLGIDFVVLEAYDEIAPQVGASIGLIGNGLRILDQLGCYEDLCKHAPHSLESSQVRSANGLIAHFRNLDQFVRTRLGYPFVFMDRQTLLQVLYNNLTDKSKILTSKRVSDVQLLTDSVTVTTIDGSVYTGDIVVGADGIHSTVRRHMWEIAKSQPGYIPSDDWNKIGSTYGCVFGISNPIGKWSGGDTTSVFHEGFSHFIVGGPEKRVYWFLFFSLAGLKTGSDIPRFTKTDEERLCGEHMDDVIDDGVTFGDLYRRRTTSVMTPLQEVVFAKWYFKRIITIGDASHKFHPLSGQGGNMAIEAAASLANTLANQLRIGSKISEDVLEKCFEQVMTLQKERATDMMRRAHTRQRLEALDGRLMKFFALHLLPRLNRERIFERLYLATSPATKLDGFDVPRRKKQAPFDDELPSKSRDNKKAFRIGTVCFLTLTALSVIMSAAPRSTKTASRSFDAMFNISVATATPVGLLPFIQPSESKRLQCFYYASMLLPFISIFVAERTQKGWRWPCLFLTLFFMLCERYSFSTVAPLMFIFSLYKSRKIHHFLPFTRQLPASNMAVLPVVLLSYYIPALLHILLPSDHGLYNMASNIYRFWPICLGVLIASFSRLFDRDATTTASTYSADWHKKVYAFTFLVSSAAHILTMLFIWKSQNTSMIDVFMSSNDMVIFGVESALWLLVHVWMMIWVGILNSSWIRTSSLILVGTFLVGPGAMASLVWFWQDSALTEILNSI